MQAVLSPQGSVTASMDFCDTVCVGGVSLSPYTSTAA